MCNRNTRKAGFLAESCCSELAFLGIVAERRFNNIRSSNMEMSCDPNRPRH